MKSIKGLIATITITWAIVFSCRLVMVQTPLTIPEEIATIFMMIEFSFFKVKQLEVLEDLSKK